MVNTETFEFQHSSPQPIFFFSHGGPTFSDRADPTSDTGAWDATRRIGKFIQEKVKPKFIIVVSAHWQATNDDEILVTIPGPGEKDHIQSDTVSNKLEPIEHSLIYDFYNWPQKFYDSQLHTYTNKAKPTTRIHIRRDNFKRQTHVNVFNNSGDKIYTIERESASSPVWSMFTNPKRHEIATIRAGFFLKSFDFHNKIGLQHRVLQRENSIAGRLRTFFLNDGYKYIWTRGTKYLERVTNPGGGDEELRERIGKVRLMRQRKFDYELLIDERKIDLEITIATAFLCMMTFWGLGDITETVGPTFLAPLSNPSEGQGQNPFELSNGENIKERVIERVIEKVVPIEHVVERIINNSNNENNMVTFEVEADSEADITIEQQ